ncbi:MAG TPA: GNAT family N-acetyltransferase [Acidimicrobiales bacterium]
MPPAPEISLVPLSTQGRDLDQAAMVAARAFHLDPFFEYLEPGAVRRARALALFWRTTLASLGDSGEVTGARQADGRLVGVAAWVPPGSYPPSVVAQVRQMFGAGRAMALRPRALWDGLRYLLALEGVHPKEPLWYLLLLVVDPSVQRGGIGTRLQAGGLATADEAGLDCYLETQKPDNLPYYRRFGYEVVEELHPVRSGPPLWTMRRPAPGSS